MGVEEVDRGLRILFRSARMALPALILLGLLISQGCTSSTSYVPSDQQNGSNLPPAPEVGRLAPDFSLTDLGANEVKLSEFRGGVVFVYFWSVSCPACRDEFAKIEALYQKYRDKGVTFIGVDLLEPEYRVRQFVQQGGYPWIFVIDTSGQVARNYRVATIPTSFVVDREGTIGLVSIGAINKKITEGWLDQATK